MFTLQKGNEAEEDIRPLGEAGYTVSATGGAAWGDAIQKICNNHQRTNSVRGSTAATSLSEAGGR